MHALCRALKHLPKDIIPNLLWDGEDARLVAAANVVRALRHRALRIDHRVY